MIKDKDNYKGSKNYSFRYFGIFFLVLFIISVLVFFIIEKEIRNIKFEEIKANEERIIKFEDDLLGQEFGIVLADLNYLHHAFDAELRDTSNYESVAQNWKEFSTHRNIYDQIRYIDEYGDEKIRINLNENGGYIVPSIELQNKKDRYFFSETVLLGKNMIFISPMDLNVENGKIQEPYKPMIRFSTPVYDRMGNNKGIIVINYLADKVLENFREIASNSKGEISLLNSDSYWISSENKDLEWMFMFEDKEQSTFKDIYEDEWKAIKRGQGQIVTSKGLFTFTSISLANRVRHYKDNDDQNIYLKEGQWHIVSSVLKDGDNKSLFIDNNFLLLLDVIKKNILYFNLMLLASGIIAFLIYLNRKSYLRVKYHSEFDNLTKVYNRRAGLEKLNDLLPTDNRRKFLCSLCFIDINGLKQVNDTLGHKLGDELILTVVDAIKSVIRKEDFVIRLGGDEFIIIFDGIDSSIAEEVWGRITSIYEEINSNENRQYLISVSHGIVSHSNNQRSQIDDLIKLADEKMYEEKRATKEDLKVIR